MVKKMVRTATAALAMTSMFAMTAFASDPDWNTNGGVMEVPGDAWVVEPTVEVELPGDLAFGINPLKLTTDEGSAQIISGNYVITNHSNVPVLVKAETKLSTATSSKVEIVADPDYDGTSGDLTSTDTDKKALWMVQLLPTGVNTVKDGEVTLGVTDLADTDGATEAAGKGEVLGTTANSVLFKLDAEGETGVTATTASGFKFAGAVDPSKTYEEADEIKVSTKFTLNTLSANQAAKSYTQKSGFDKTVVEVAASAAP